MIRKASTGYGRFAVVPDPKHDEQVDGIAELLISGQSPSHRLLLVHQRFSQRVVRWSLTLIDRVSPYCHLILVFDSILPIAMRKVTTQMVRNGNK